MGLTQLSRAALIAAVTLGSLQPPFAASPMRATGRDDRRRQQARPRVQPVYARLGHDHEPDRYRHRDQHGADEHLHARRAEGRLQFTLFSYTPQSPSGPRTSTGYSASRVGEDSNGYPWVLGSTHYLWQFDPNCNCMHPF